MFGYFGILDHSSWLDNAFSDIPDGIKQLLHVLTAVNMRNKPYLVISWRYWCQKDWKSKKLVDEIEDNQKVDEIEEVTEVEPSPSGTLQFSPLGELDPGVVVY